MENIEDSNEITSSNQENMNTSVDTTTKILTSDSQLDHLLRAIDEGKKPWYLETSSIYAIIKKSLSQIFTVGSVPDISNQQNIAIKTATSFLIISSDFIHALTKSNVKFTEKEMEDLLILIDSSIENGLKNFDSYTDSLRQQLSASLKNLRVAVSEHIVLLKNLSSTSSESIVSISNENIAMINSAGIKFVTIARDVIVWFQQTPSTTKLETVVKIAISLYSTVSTVVNKTLRECSTDSKIFIIKLLDTKKCSGESSWLDILQEGSDKYVSATLLTAQPYVHFAVKSITPALVTAVNLGKPYIVKSLPYVSSVTDNVKSKLSKNKSIENILTTVVQKANEVSF